MDEGLFYFFLCWVLGLIISSRVLRQHLGWLFVGRVIAGMTGASFTTATAYIADVSEPEKRAQNFGLVGAAFGLGFIIGPALGGQLSIFGTRVPFFAAAALSLLNCLYGYFILPESLPLNSHRKFEWKRANPVGALTQFKKYPYHFRTYHFYHSYLSFCTCHTKHLAVL